MLEGSLHIDSDIVTGFIIRGGQKRVLQQLLGRHKTHSHSSDKYKARTQLVDNIWK